MKSDRSRIPEDIVFRLQQEYSEYDTYTEALGIIKRIQQDPLLNVGWVQLSRAIIMIAKGDIHVMRS